MIRTNPFDLVYKKSYSKEFPNFLDVELTNNCNLSCKFCSRNIMRRERGFLTEVLFNKILRECINFSSPIRFIRWGEPFLHNKIIQFSKSIINSGLPLHITTNGLLVNEDMSKNIVDMELDSIIFSMQGVEDTYKDMRGANYNSLKDNILNLIDIRGENEKPYIRITSTMTNESDSQIIKFKKYWSEKVDEISIGKTDWSRIDGNPPINARYVPCTEVYQKLSIDWNGIITACCADYDNLLSLGDIEEDSLYYIWNYSKRLEKIRGMLDNMEHNRLKLCRSCYPAYA